MKENRDQNFEEMHSLWRKHLKQMAGSEKIDGLELVNLMRMNMHIIDASLNQNPQIGDLSGPRMGILMRLIAEEDHGNHEGISPTRLSHYQSVKKNTVSSLLSGLEEQGLIERTIDTQDKRGFNIRITATGRERIIAGMPERMKCVNELTSGLTSEEKQQMISLLTKLRSSMMVSRQTIHNCKTEEFKK